MLLGARIGSWFKRSSPEPTPTGRTVAKYLQYISTEGQINTGFLMDTSLKGFRLGVRQTHMNGVADGCWCFCCCLREDFNEGIVLCDDGIDQVSLYDYGLNYIQDEEDTSNSFSYIDFNYKNSSVYSNGHNKSCSIEGGEWSFSEHVPNGNVILGQK